MMAACSWGHCRVWLRSVHRKANLRFQQEWGVGDQGGGKRAAKTRRVQPERVPLGARVQGGGKGAGRGQGVQGGGKWAVRGQAAALLWKDWLLLLLGVVLWFLLPICCRS